MTTQRDHYLDPMSDVALAPVVKHSSSTLDGKLEIGPLRWAGRVLEQKWADCKPTWQRLRGPLAATWMGLLRI